MAAITRITKRNIIDSLNLANIPWWGRLDEVDFLNRIYSLNEMESYDGRFKNAAGDVWQHRVNNYDWEDDWVFSDARFGLDDGNDECFLKFLCETIHPLVRPDQSDVEKLLAIYNSYLKFDGWMIYQSDTISGQPIFSYRPLLSGAPDALEHTKVIALESSYVRQQIKRMQNSVEEDPAVAIGTAKEFLETICKTILEDTTGAAPSNEDLPKLVKLTLKQLNLVPEDIPDHAKAADTIRVMLSNLAAISNGLAEVRNAYGSGHGKSSKSKGLEPRHARLAVGAASTLAVFLYETYQKKTSHM